MQKRLFDSVLQTQCANKKERRVQREGGSEEGRQVAIVIGDRPLNLTDLRVSPKTIQLQHMYSIQTIKLCA